MPTLSIKDVAVGSMVTFRSKNANNTVEWRGVLESPSSSYRAIRSYMNPGPENEAVRQTDPSVPSDVTDLSYFLITLDNSSESEAIVAFAEEWIEAGSLQVLNLGTKVLIQVEDPRNDPEATLSILANARYACKIVSQ